MKVSHLIIGLIIIVMSINSCSRKVMVRRYYILESEAAFDTTAFKIETKLPYKLDVRDFRVARAFDQTKIALRSESNELNYYYYHYWAMRPNIAISDFVFEYIDSIGLFQSVSNEYSIEPDFLITGQVYSFERVEKKKSSAAHIHATLQFINGKSQAELLRYEFDRSELLKKDVDMNSFAIAMSKILQQEVEEFVRRIMQYFDSTKLN